MDTPATKKRGRPVGSTSRLPDWVREFAVRWSGLEFETDAARTAALADTAGCVRVYLQGWRMRMGLSERTVGAMGMSVRLAAAWVGVPERTWESWEGGRAVPAPYLWKLLRLLLRDARAGKLAAEDAPDGVNPGIAWRGVKPTETLEDPE